MEALEFLAQKEGVELSEYENFLSGPVFTGTLAEANKFHDDISL